MTYTIKTNLCFFCKHYDAKYADETLAQGRPRRRCTAFPEGEGIPLEIISYIYDHRAAHPDDNGIQFEMYESRDTLGGSLKSQSENFLPLLIQVTLQGLNGGRREGRVMPPLIENNDPHLLLKKLLEIKRENDDPVERSRLGRYFPDSTLDKLIQAAEKAIADRG